LPLPDPIRRDNKTSGRRKAVITLGAAAFLLLAIMVSQASFNLKFISPDSNEQLLFFAGLSGLIFFAFVALTVVLGRNLQTLCGAACWSCRIKISHATGGRQPAALILARNRHVLVFLRAHESIYR
jgi:hypothetical protein